MKLAGTIGTTLSALLVAIEVLAAELGRDNPDVQEAERLARNGAGMAKAMHDAAHGIYIMASQLQPHVQGWFDVAFAMINEIKSADADGFEAMAQRRFGGFEGAGTRARWMVDHVTWDALGKVVLPGGEEE